ncbi:hypothetical protein TNCV_2483201 [Trichonephila clavipes]|uniref:Uncharacterized protein n=1 Tax=Trichonephila clavipes TaxID=2585209 RepID=A0A8X6VZD5_TRICX|nr:hypothetical protein TNCV_2483201 [Trichonephila clavipes]
MSGVSSIYGSSDLDIKIVGPKQINLEADSDDVQELLDFHNQELTMDELIHMHEQQQNIEEFESLNPVQPEDQIKVGHLR